MVAILPAGVGWTHRAPGEPAAEYGRIQKLTAPRKGVEHG